MDLQKRKSIRLDGFDYSQSGAYFITICVEDRHEMLGRIVGDGVLDVPMDSTNFSTVRLSDIGLVAEKYILGINRQYDNISIDRYVIMPNHIHLILVVENTKDGTSRTPSPTNAVVPSTISTLKRFVNKEVGFSLFQRSYHDHIIRDENEYCEICSYIEANPSNWEIDEFNSKKK